MRHSPHPPTNARRLLVVGRISWIWLRRRLERAFAGCQKMHILPNRNVALMANQKQHLPREAGFSQRQSQQHQQRKRS
jgi:hypothetical protein